MQSKTESELVEPQSDIAWIKANVNTIHDIGSFKQSKEENCDHYGRFAEQYDTITSKIGMNDQYHLASFLKSKFPDLPKDIKIIDFGCGTGLAGDALALLDFTVIDGNDGSQQMLEMAKQKSSYRKLFPLMVGTDPIPSDIDRDYDLVVSTGCMVRGHFPNTCFEAFLEVLKPGGLIAITSREVYLHNETDNGTDYIGAIRKLSDRGIMEDN